MEEQRAHRALTAGRGAENAYARDVVPGILLRDRFVPENAISEASVFEIAPGDVVKRAGAVVRSHAIDLHHDEAEGCKGLNASREALGHKGTLRPGVDVLNDGILLTGIEIDRPVDNAPYLRFSVAALGVEGFCRLPSCRAQRTVIGGVDRHDQARVGGATQFGDGRKVETRIGIDEILAVRRELQRVICLCWSQRREPRTVEANLVAMDVVGILVWVYAAGLEVYLLCCVIDVIYSAYYPIAMGDLANLRTGLAIEEIEVLPAVA